MNSLIDKIYEKGKEIGRIDGKKELLEKLLKEGVISESVMLYYKNQLLKELKNFEPILETKEIGE